MSGNFVGILLCLGMKMFHLYGYRGDASGVFCKRKCDGKFAIQQFRQTSANSVTNNSDSDYLVIFGAKRWSMNRAAQWNMARCGKRYVCM